MKAKRGIYAAAISPLANDGHLDVNKLVAYCKYLVDEGSCDGVAPMGTTGEANSLSLRERMQLPEKLAAAGFAKDAAIIGTGLPSVNDSIELTRACLAHGYCNVLVLPPFFYKDVHDDGLFAYYASIIEGVNDNRLRVFLYHFPKISQIPLTPGLVARLRQAFGETVAGLKDSSGDWNQTKAFLDVTGGEAKDFDIYPSSEAFVLDALSSGCAGIISGSANLFGSLIKKAVETDDQEQRAAIEKVKRARELADSYPLIPAMKYGQALRSVDESWMKVAPPLLPLSNTAQAQLKQALDDLNI